MPVTSEEDVDGDAARLADVRGNSRLRSRSRHGSSGSRQQSRGPDRSDDFAQTDEEQEGAYSSASASAADSGEDGDGGEDDYDDEDDDDDDDDDGASPPPPPFSQHAFAPPFYGRPPTPLPPSPSLTSLLRPSRPTTPDASDDDHHHHHHHHHHHSHHYQHDHHHDNHHHHYPDLHHHDDPVPRARPKVPTYEYYGFVLYLFSSLSFLIYLLWSYLPSPFLHALGIYYYPNRWWSLAIPSFLVMLLVYIYVALAGYNLEILTLPLESVETVVDEAAQVAVVDEKGRILKKTRRKKKKEEEEEGVGGGGSGGGGGGGGREKEDEERERGRGREKESGEIGTGEGLRRDGGLNWKEVWNEGTDAVMDVPLAGVCEVLYGEGREWESEDDGEVGITRL